MPTIAENKKYWEGRYDWTERGDEWSRPWGSVEMQWYISLLPRIQAHLPTRTILEIACGSGRWTNYLREWCDRLIAVDLAAECVETCRQRFKSASNIEYHVNDGKSLDMTPAESVDFVFSYDSLVHADPTVFDAYFGALSRILTPDGVAFLHHSNLGEYRARYSRIRRLPKLEGLLATLGVLDGYLHWRDPDVSAGLIARLAEKHGLQCITQEIVHWRTRHAAIDCMSTIVRNGSALARPNHILRNGTFMSEAAIATQLSAAYLYSRTR